MLHWCLCKNVSLPSVLPTFRSARPLAPMATMQCYAGSIGWALSSLSVDMRRQSSLIGSLANVLVVGDSSRCFQLTIVHGSSNIMFPLCPRCRFEIRKTCGRLGCQSGLSSTLAELKGEHKTRGQKGEETYCSG